MYIAPHVTFTTTTTAITYTIVYIITITYITIIITLIIIPILARCRGRHFFVEGEWLIRFVCLFPAIYPEPRDLSVDIASMTYVSVSGVRRLGCPCRTCTINHNLTERAVFCSRSRVDI